MITAMIESLSLTEKVTLNIQLAAAIAAEVSGTKQAPIVIKTDKVKTEKVKTKKVKDPNAPKKAAAPGVKAWNAFVKHCKTTQPALFTETKKESERLAICGAIKEKDTPAYEAWVKNWLATASAAPSDTEASSPPSPVIAPIAAAPVVAPIAPIAAAIAPIAETPASKKASKAAAKLAAEAAAKLAAEAAAKLAAEAEADEEEGMVKKIISGQNYLMDAETHELYKTNATFEEVGDNVGKWKGASVGGASEIEFHD